MDSNLLPRCLSLDLEVTKQTGRIRAFAAVRPGVDQPLIFERGNLHSALAKLDDFATESDFLLGHNLIDFDLQYLKAAKPDLRMLKLPAVDTLWLNPLAFPRNPYHKLVKHYQDGQLIRGRINDPELDARLVLKVLSNQYAELQKPPPDLLVAWHYLTAIGPYGTGFDTVFSDIRGESRPDRATAEATIREWLAGNACKHHSQRVFEQTHPSGWPLAYALAWISVSGGNSVIPPWVRHHCPQAVDVIQTLRDTPCGRPGCEWCSEKHDARKELKRWFGFDDFRPEPVDEKKRPLQRVIVEAAMTREHVLGILPTGTGKSLCYQIPALSRYDKTGVLTIVISPLVALMADQLLTLERSKISSCVTINGLLSPPERANALDRVRLGNASILIISPEQLRSKSVRRVINQREIGGWVLDEAHCLSKWGHDFRPDYRYVGRFIRERAGEHAIPPVMCLTATAKPDVVADITQYFHDELDIELRVIDGGARRENLRFVVVPTTGGEKFSHIHQILMADLPREASGGAIIYCATRRQTEELAEFLQAKKVSVEFYHAKLPPNTKKDVQQRFIDGELRVITATNAFGMGIDKPDVRLVIHADIPGSLENYLQEAGRAGRDRQPARCVLMYSTDDVERQFGMSAMSRLTQREIRGILRALRNLDHRKRMQGEIVATSGEILLEEDEQIFERDSATDDTRVRTAVSWLEEAVLLTREENDVRVFPSSLRVDSVEEARKLLAKKQMRKDYCRSLLRIAETLIDADPDEGISTDELMGISGLSAEGVRRALFDLEEVGIASNDTALTAYVHVGVERQSRKRFEDAAEMEAALIARMRELEPNMAKGESWPLHLRVASQDLRDQGVADPLPERLWRILRSISADGRGEEGGTGSIDVRRRDTETVQVTLRRDWSDLEELATRRREGAKLLLEHLISCLPPKSRGTDLLAETTLGKLLDAIKSNLFPISRDPEKLLDRALLWLHEQEVIRLHKGLAVFRQAMTIKLRPGRRQFADTDFKLLDLHYKGQVLQIHVMNQYAKQGMEDMAMALRLAMDYFHLNQDEFLRRWMPDRDKETERETTPESWRAIVENLRNPHQKDIVADERKQTNVLVLAGPGSGKTRVLVHRIAYLVRARRENPRGILALAYNRHAAVEIRRRLMDLIGGDARGVTVLTCHALAMRLVGISFQERAGRELDDNAFKNVLRRATALLRGEGQDPEEADDLRERLLAGFRWILVDEYQDIGAEEYNLISALAGRTMQDADRKLTLFAVGDDDQNIYAFKGASVKFIRRFEADYGPKPVYLTENYRSSGHIISAANALIAPAKQRMKADHPIRIDRAREKHPPGGEWERLDKVSRGRVQILSVAPDPVAQGQAAMNELQRLSELKTDWKWSSCAVITREWQYLDPVRAYCEIHQIPVQSANEETPSLWRLRETRTLVEWLKERDSRLVDGKTLGHWIEGQPKGPWMELLRQALDEYMLEMGDAEGPVDQFIEWLAEWGREVRKRQRGLLLLTAHRAKGLEFDHVVVLDGGWNQTNTDEERRLYYVAMTRARQTLALMKFNQPSASGGDTPPGLVREPDARTYKGRSQQTAMPFDFPVHGPVMRREFSDVPPALAEVNRQYRQPSLREVDLGFAGRRPAGNALHRVIAAMSPGDSLGMRKNEQGRWELLDQSGTVVGRLAQAFEPPEGTRFRSASVFAIVFWSREASDPQYRDHMACDTWEVVVPELVFEPESE